MKTENYKTTYKTAVYWLGNEYVLCNRIPEIDNTLWDNMDWSEIPDFAHFYQFFLSNCSEQDVMYLQEHFGLIFAYSEKLDLYVLCVDHYGTAWDYVPVKTDIKYAACELGNTPSPF